MSLKTVNNVVHYKSAYWAHMSFGTPAQKFKVVFDTGSGHLILPSAYCKSKVCKAHQRFRRSASKSAVDINSDGSVVKPEDAREQINVQFGTGDVQGVFIEDAVCITEDGWNGLQLGTSELPAGCMRLRSIAATALSAQPFSDFEFDGVMGMSLPGLSEEPEFNFMREMGKHLQARGSSRPYVFSVFLGNTEGEKSEIAMGGWVENRLDGDVAWNDVLFPEMGHWLIRVRRIVVDGQPLSLCANGCKAVADTGTSLLAVPTASLSELYEMLYHQAPLSGECLGGGPELRLELDGLNITLGPEDYSSPMPFKDQDEEDEPQWGVGRFGQGGETRPDMYCKPMLMTMDLPEPLGPDLFILGEPVLRKYYTVYDTEAERVGFGLARHSPAPEASEDKMEQDEDWDDSDAWGGLEEDDD